MKNPGMARIILPTYNSNIIGITLSKQACAIAVLQSTHSSEATPRLLHFLVKVLTFLFLKEAGV